MAIRSVDRRRTPAYPFSEAAHYLNLPTNTLRAWCLGQVNRVDGKVRHFRAVIVLDGKRGEGLSFLNLVEAHVLAAIRRVHGVSLPKVRKALEFVAGELNVERPLADANFRTDGADLFVEELGRLVNVSSEGQLEMRSMLDAHLRRIDRDPRGIPIKLYPFTRPAVAGDSRPAVEVDPRVAFGRPVLIGKAVPTAVLADRFKAGDSLAVLAGDFDVGTELVEEAIRCELDRRKAA